MFNSDSKFKRETLNKLLADFCNLQNRKYPLLKINESTFDTLHEFIKYIEPVISLKEPAEIK